MKKFIVFLLALSMIFALVGCDSRDYDEAMTLYGQDKFDEARAIFVELGDYENSQDMVKKCDYGMAKELVNAGEYDAAIEIFTMLGDYEDSIELAAKCQLGRAVELYDSGDIDGAVKLLAEIQENSDATNVLHQIMFDQVELYTDELTIATDYAAKYYNTFTSKLMMSLFTGGGSVTVSVDVNDPDFSALQASAEKLKALRFEFTGIFTKEIISKCDNKMQKTYNAYIETADDAETLYSIGGFSKFAVSSLSSGSSSTNDLVQLANKLANLETLVNDL